MKYFFEDLSFRGLMNNISRSLSSEIASKIILSLISINGKKKQIPSTMKNPSSKTI